MPGSVCVEGLDQPAERHVHGQGPGLVDHAGVGEPQQRHALTPVTVARTELHSAQGARIAAVPQRALQPVEVLAQALCEAKAAPYPTVQHLDDIPGKHRILPPNLQSHVAVPEAVEKPGKPVLRGCTPEAAFEPGHVQLEDHGRADGHADLLEGQAPGTAEEGRKLGELPAEVGELSESVP